ncbi:MAG: FAD-dependent oxidoreductase [Thermoanaerobaculia bacterium]|nr:FAD-dependent oxidoreductase [Thermoanaerobaculia bacterium]
METSEFVVVGGGVAGVCAAYFLASEGREVVLLERDVPAPDCPLSSSGEVAKVFRCAYGRDRAMTRLCMASLRQWRRFQEESGSTLVEPSGMVVFGADRPETLAKWRDPGLARFARESTETMRAEGLEHELLDKSQLIERFPQIRKNDGYDHAILDKTAGLIYAQRAVRTIARLAIERGAEIRPHVTVEDVARRGQDVEMLATSKGNIKPKRAVVFAAGHRNATLVPELRKKTRVTRQRVLYLKPEKAGLYDSEHFPAVVSLNEWRYVLPIHGAGITKVADDDKYHPDRMVDLGDSTEDVDVDPGFSEDARSFLRDFVPGLADAEEVDYRTCCYTNTREERYLIYKRGNAVVLSACSGHGFKNGPMTGMLGAALASGRGESHPLYSDDFRYENAGDV